MFGRTSKGAPKIIWCDRLKDYSQKRKRNQTPQSDEDSEKERLDGVTTSKTKKANRKEEREDKVSDTLNQLREKHGNSFTPMQCRIWSEMVVGEVHSRLDDPPNTSMFMRAGGASVTKKDPNSRAQALTRAASRMGAAIAMAPSPPPVTQSASGCAHELGSSPAKVIES